MEDTKLVGWGSWGGRGVKKPKKSGPGSRYLKTSGGIAPEARKDAGKTNVIITEKKDKKATNFLPKDLPYPYTSVAQYEASFANPIGGEWNSRAVHQRQTLPRVTKKVRNCGSFADDSLEPSSNRSGSCFRCRLYVIWAFIDFYCACIVHHNLNTYCNSGLFMRRLRERTQKRNYSYRH